MGPYRGDRCVSRTRVLGKRIVTKTTSLGCWLVSLLLPRVSVTTCFAASSPHSFPVAVFDPFGPIAHLPLASLCGFLPGRCHFSTFKQCQEWLSRLSRATARPAKPEDLFAFAYHAWCLGLTEEDQHTHLCQPGQARLFSLWGFISLGSHPSPIAGHGALGC